MVDIPKKSPNWKWLVPTAIIGIALIGLAASAPWQKNRQWASVSSSGLVNLGTAFVFAALAVLLEPRLTRAARRVAEELQAPLRKRIEDLESNVETLGEQTKERLRDRDDRIERTLRALDESQTFETVTKALESANELNALAGGIATVQGGTDPEAGPLSLRVRFLWGVDPASNGPSLRIQAVCDEDQYYLARPTEIQGVDTDHNDRLCSEVKWEPELQAADVGFQLVHDVQRKGPWLGNGTLDWGKAVSDLSRTLRMAVDSRRAVAAMWRMTAPVFEFVGEDWAITEAGVENRAIHDDVVFRADEFPSWYPGGERGNDEALQLPPRDPAAPAPNHRVIKRAVAHLPLRHSPNTPPGWVRYIAKT